MALRGSRRPQHRAVLRHAVRQCLPFTRRHGGRPGRRSAVGRRRPDDTAAHGTRCSPHGARRAGRRGGRGPGGADNRRTPRSARPARRPDRHLVDGTGSRADQALGPCRRPAAHLDRLAADRGRAPPRTGRAGGRGSSAGAHRHQPGGLRLPVARRHRAGVLDLVLGFGAAAGRPRLTARVALAAGRDRGRLGGARPEAYSGSGGGHGARLRSGGVGSAHLSEGRRSRRCGSGNRCGRPGASPGPADPWW